MILDKALRQRNMVRLDDPEAVAKLLDGIRRTNSGAFVNEHSSWAQATVYSCVRILSECIAMLPVKLMERSRKNGTTYVNEVTDHNAVDVLNTPNDWMTPHEFMQFWISSVELRGNFFAFKNRNGRGEVRELLPIRGRAVSVRQDPDFSLVYMVGNGHPDDGQHDPSEIMHGRGLSADGFKGLSTISLHREAIGLAIQTEAHGGALFRNGAQMGTVFAHPQALKDQAYNRLKESIDDIHSGARNAFKPIILEEGMTVSAIGMTAEDSQFLETRKFQKQEIACIYGVPMFLLNDVEKSTTWGTGLEQISKSFVTYTLKPRLSRVRQTLAMNLLRDSERKTMYFDFDTDEFNLADMLARFQAYQYGISNGIINPNEARAEETLNPREGGDEYRVTPNSQPESTANGKNPGNAPGA
jgi:HK97 family phage portal protein